MILEPMSAAVGSTSTTQPNMAGLNELMQQQNARTQEAKKFAIYSQANGRLQMGSQAQQHNTNHESSKLTRKVILSTTVGEDELNEQ